MNPPLQQNLNEIATHWTVVRQAHGDEAVGAARAALMERYGGAVYRYLLGALRDRDAADDLFQDFALRFLRGDFRNADPERGRFRDFVKTSLFHLIVDYQNRRRNAPRVLPVEAVDVAAAPQGLSCSEQQFLESWAQRDPGSDLAGESWSGTVRWPGKPITACCAAVPTIRTCPRRRWPTSLSGENWPRPVKADWVRQTLKRAREHFTDLLVDELAATLEEPTRQRLEEELQDLGMLDYCREALDRRGS